MDYQYPIEFDWTTDEIMKVIQFYQTIEKAYEKGTDRAELLNAYNEFKRIVPSKSEEKKLCGEFEEVSGYSSYQAIKKAKNSPEGTYLKM